MDYFFFTDPTRSVAPTFFRPVPVQYLPLVQAILGLLTLTGFPPLGCLLLLLTSLPSFSSSTRES